MQSSKSCVLGAVWFGGIDPFWRDLDLFLGVFRRFLPGFFFAISRHLWAMGSRKWLMKGSERVAKRSVRIWRSFEGTF